MSEQKFCKYCGKALVNGECSCDEFQRHKKDYKNTSQDGGATGSSGDGFSAQFNREQNPHEDYQETGSTEKMFDDIKQKAADFFNGQTYEQPQEDAARDVFEHNIPIMPDCIQPEKDEVMVRQYNIALLRTRLKFMKAEGRLEVTNKRVLFRAAGKGLKGPIVQEHQFKLDEIGGIEIHDDYKFSLLNFILFLILELIIISPSISATTGLSLSGGSSTRTASLVLNVILWLIAVFGGIYLRKYGFISDLLSVLATAFITTAALSSGNGFLSFLSVVTWIYLIVMLFISSMVPNLVIKIKTKGATGAIVIGSQKAIFRRKTGDDYSGFAEVLPWEDTKQAINELGTMIDDLQQQGNYAIEKWTRG